MHAGKPKALKKNNRKAVLDFLRVSGKVSIADISKYVGLSKTTLMKVLTYFTETGYVVPAGKGRSTHEGGKKPVLYKFNVTAGFIIGVHITTGSILIALTDLNADILKAYSIPLKKNSEIQYVIDKIVDACRCLMEDHIGENRLIGIGICFAGITDSKRGIVVSSPHFPTWGEEIHFRQMLMDRLAVSVPVLINNECRFQAFAEKEKGIAKDKSNIVVVECGRGLAAGIIVKNRIKLGAHHLAGEIGHMVLNPLSKDRCRCGGRGCFEVMVSAKRILKMARQKYDVFQDSLIFSQNKPGRVTPEDIFSAADKGDRLAQDIMDDVAGWFAMGFLNIILMYDPEIIVIQGVYSKAGDYFKKRLRKKINALSLVKIRKDVEIEYSTFGEERGVVGAASYIISEFFNQETYEG